MICRKNIKTTASVGGFTLIEVVVVIVVLGIIASLVTVSWSSFIRQQEIRQEAGNLHKEILAMKARALESVDNVVLRYSATDNKYTILYKVEDADGNETTASRSFSVNDKIEITFGGAGSAPGTPPITNNAWSDTVLVIADNLNAYRPYGNGGWIVIKSKNDRPAVQYSVAIEDNGVKPELYRRNGTGGTWKKI